MSLITSEFTLLTEEQVFGDNKLDIFNHISTDCITSDFATLEGGLGSNKGNEWFILSQIPGIVSTTGTVFDKVRNIDVNVRFPGIRPILSYSDISDLPSDKMIEKDGLLELEYGEYPQNSVSKSLSNILDEEFKNGKLKETGKKYTSGNPLYEHFVPFEYIEYEYDNQKYIKAWSGLRPAQLSNGENYVREDVWIEVSPIKWYIDEKGKKLIPKTCLAAGIDYYNNNFKIEDFTKTNIYKFLNRYFAIDIIPKDVIEEFKDNKNHGLEDMIKDKEVIKNSSNDNEILPSIRVAADWWCKAIAGSDIDEDDYYSAIAKLLSRKPVSMTSIDEKQLKVFRDTLCEEIKEWLSTPRGIAVIDVDYNPNRILYKPLIESGINSKNLPMKTTMWVTSDSVVVRSGGREKEIFSNSIQDESDKIKNK